MKILRTRFYLTTAMVVIMLTRSGFSQNADTRFTLSDCLHYALENSSAIKKAKLQEEGAHRKIDEVVSSGLPQINLNGSMVNNVLLPVQMIPGEIFGGAPGSSYKVKFGSKYNTTLTGQASQMIFNGSFWVGLEAARQSKDYYALGAASTKDKTYYLVATAYYQAQMAGKRVKLLDYNLNSLQKALADIEVLRDNGKVKSIEADRIRVSFNNVQYQKKNAQEQLAQAYNNLKYQMGMAIEQPLSITELENGAEVTETFTISEPVTGSANVADYSGRADFRQLQSVKELQELNRKNEIAKYLPSISAVGNYSWAVQKNKFSFQSNDWYNYYSVGLQFSLPIFSGGQTSAKIQQAELEVRQANENVLMAGRGIAMEIANAEISMKNAQSNIELGRQNAALAEKVYTNTQLEFNQGLAGSAALIEAETKLREAQTNLINAQLSWYIAKLDLEKARGSIVSYLQKDNKIK